MLCVLCPPYEAQYLRRQQKQRESKYNDDQLHQCSQIPYLKIIAFPSQNSLDTSRHHRGWTRVITKQCPSFLTAKNHALNLLWHLRQHRVREKPQWVHLSAAQVREAACQYFDGAANIRTDHIVDIRAEMSSSSAQRAQRGINSDVSLLGDRRKKTRRCLCNVLTLPCMICAPNNRHRRDGWAFTCAFVLANIGLLVGIYFTWDIPAVIFTLFLVPTIVTLVRFVAAMLYTIPRMDDEANSEGIVLMMPCFTEGLASLTQTIASITESDLGGMRPHLVIVSDGRVVGKGNNGQTCEQIILDLLGRNRSSLYYREEFTDFTLHRGVFNHVPIYLLCKHENKGKRDSQLMMLEFVRRMRGIDYVFMTDADSYFNRYAIRRLVACLRADRRVAAACGEIRVSNTSDSCIASAQAFEYFVSQFHSRVAESHLDQVTCLPGAFVAFRRDIFNDAVKRAYATEPKSLHTAQLLTIGEDRYLSSLIMKHFVRMTCLFVADAILHTNAPSTFSVLRSQRRRWGMSALHNMVDNVLMSNVYWGTRLMLGYNIVMNMFQPSIFGLAMLIVVRLLMAWSVQNGITLGFAALFLVFVGITIIRFHRYDVIKHLPAYIIMTPILYLIIPFTTAFGASNVNWGKTRQLEEVEED